MIEPEVVAHLMEQDVCNPGVAADDPGGADSPVTPQVSPACVFNANRYSAVS
jgi:hypothetical protein